MCGNFNLMYVTFWCYKVFRTPERKAFRTLNTWHALHSRTRTHFTLKHSLGRKRQFYLELSVLCYFTWCVIVFTADRSANNIRGRLCEIQGLIMAFSAIHWLSVGLTLFNVSSTLRQSRCFFELAWLNLLGLPTYILSVSHTPEHYGSCEIR